MKNKQTFKNLSGEHKQMVRDLVHLDYGTREIAALLPIKVASIARVRVLWKKRQIK